MKVIVTGGAGFIGCNAANRFLTRGHDVVIVDDLSRPGTSKNLDWLRSRGSVRHHRADIRDERAMRDIFGQHADAGLVLHLAGQVAVTTSVTDPRSDFEINALGTFNVLEAIRAASIEAPVIFSSTNKVYGGMEDAEVIEGERRYSYHSLPNGVPETRNLDFHSPYGCSKGAADQYVRDYHRIYGLRTVVFRQSCIYGYRQFGLEDQGWIAWFIIATHLGRPITVFGDGKQVRDVLFIDDLVDAYEQAAARIDVTAGQVYNIGGGPSNVMSLIDLLDYIGERQGHPVPHAIADWRPGDQRVYVSDIRRAQRDFGWKPKVEWRTGLERLYDWVGENKELFLDVLPPVPAAIAEPEPALR